MKMRKTITERNYFNQKGIQVGRRMFKQVLPFCLVLILVLVLPGCGTIKEVVSGGKTENNKTLQNGDLAPDFTAELADGSTFALSEQRGKKVLLNFWATWCGPCVGEMPALERLHEEYPEELTVVAVNCQETPETVDEFIKENGYTFPIAYDESGEISQQYPTDGIPFTLIIDEEGVIQQIFLGAADADEQYVEYKQALGLD